MMRKSRRVVIGLAVCLWLIPGAVSAAEPLPSARLQLSEGSVAAGVGFSWGKGTLTFKGKDYPVKVEGLSVGDVGVTQVQANGDVYNLNKLEDFNGNYTAVGAGATLAGGGDAITMTNQNGVKIKLRNTTQGVALKLDVSGIKMSVKQ